MTQITDVIRDHVAKGLIPLKDQQIAYIPRLSDDQIEYSIQSYLRNGVRRRINPSNQLCLKLRYLKFMDITPRTFYEYRNNEWSMNTLVNNGIIHPFALFIDGRFIPWEMITLYIAEENNYFLMINAQNYDSYIPLIKDASYAQILELPDNVKYYSGYDMFYDTYFTFDEDGKYSRNDGIHKFYVPDNISTHVMHNYWYSGSPVVAMTVFANTSIKLSPDNMIVFKNSLFSTGTKSILKRAYENYAGDEGYKPYLDIVTSDKTLDPNPVVTFDSTLLSITNENNEDLEFIAFVNYKFTERADNVAKSTLSYLSPLVEDKFYGRETPQSFKDLEEEFDLTMDIHTKYDTNIANAIANIMSYDASIFNPVIKDRSNLVIEEHTGEWVLNHTNYDGILRIPRYASDTKNEYIFVLVNGEMYKYLRLGKYYAGDFNLPIQGIEPTDVVEFLRFQNANNVVFDTVIYENDGYKDYNPDYINDTMVLFSTETDLDYFDFPLPEDGGLQHFPVAYSLDEDESGKIKITLDNPFYYGKKLTVAYKNRYNHFSAVVTEDTTEIKFNLGKSFMYCNDYSKYAVFRNGRKLTSDNYRLTLPVRPTTPFTDFEIYITLPLYKDDRIDILYVPSMMHDDIIIPTIPTSGDIVVDKSKLGYNLSNDLYMIWVNGKKVPKSQIVNISSTRMRIITDQHTTDTLCITKYIPDIDNLAEAFAENEAMWDKVISQLTDEQIYALLGITGDTLTNTEPNIYTESVGVRSIMYELIRDKFLANSIVDPTEPFIYDYQDVDKSIIDGYDDGGNAILDVENANNTDNLDIERVWP